MVVGQCALMSEIASALFETWLETGCKFAKSAFGPSRHIAPPHELSRYRGEADIAFRCITPLGLWVHGLVRFWPLADMRCSLNVRFAPEADVRS